MEKRIFAIQEWGGGLLRTKTVKNILPPSSTVVYARTSFYRRFSEAIHSVKTGKRVLKPGVENAIDTIRGDHRMCVAIEGAT